MNHNPNLAGVPAEKATEQARRELEWARIRALPYDASRHPEVWAMVKGHISGPQGQLLELTRAWYYWVVQGPVPLDLARRINRDPCAPHIRVVGHCDAPPPAHPWVTWYYGDKKVVPIEQQEELVRVAKALKIPIPDVLFLPYAANHEPNIEGAYGVIESYHIDSLVGLRVFADLLHAEGWT